MTEAITERRSDRELVVTRTFAATPVALWRAWTEAELFRQWWVPKSFPITLLSCEIDARTGGGYRLEFANPNGGEPMAFFGTYTTVELHAKLAWTNDETPDGAVTTVTFTREGARTVVAVSNLFPTKEACDEEIQGGAADGLPESLTQLADFLTA